MRCSEFRTACSSGAAVKPPISPATSSQGREVGLGNCSSSQAAVAAAIAGAGGGGSAMAA